jgi:hypothetical protein
LAVNRTYFIHASVWADTSIDWEHFPVLWNQLCVELRLRLHQYTSPPVVDL